MAETLPDRVTDVLVQVRLLVLDSDGVLTDGGVYITDDGREFRRFDIKDGLGLKRVMAAGIHVAVISSSSTEAVRHRCARLGITEVYLGVSDKSEGLSALCARLDIPLDHVAYMGDDLADLAAMKAVGLPCAPADAVEAIRAVARLVTVRPGGHGAVRELCDVLVREKR
jgi:3-deoxy-D-manno-octulosonate 8-phosphate phosphatase (KDO 8-P phosphatase)